MNNENNSFYIACVDTDGTRPVVWGVGKGGTLDEATLDAQADASNYLYDATELIKCVEITHEQYLAALAGDVSAEGLTA